MKRGAIKQDLRILYQSQGSTNCVIPENVESIENTKKHGKDGKHKKKNLDVALLLMSFRVFVIMKLAPKLDFNLFTYFFEPVPILFKGTQNFSRAPPPLQLEQCPKATCQP